MQVSLVTEALQVNRKLSAVNPWERFMDNSKWNIVFIISFLPFMNY